MTSKYNEMNDWLFEQENFGLRIERMYDDLDLKDCQDITKYARTLKWLQAAFDAGRLMERDERDA